MNLILLALLQEAGIAAAYPGDEHIERDPRVPRVATSGRWFRSPGSPSRR